MHKPLTLEGWQVWDLVQRLGGQVRVAGGMSGGAVLGWDMGAALQLGTALGLSPLIIAELLPPIEAVMVRKINEHLQAGSGLANASPEVFQRWSAASATVGIEQEKLAQILQDVNDRVGDFLQTGGGPMADFFENIAPRVGVTADQFARLSGPEALQLYVDSLECAGVSQQEMTFYLEAMASDATRLIPLLQNGGAEMTRLGAQAQALGAVLDADAIAAMRRSELALVSIGQVFTGVRNRIAVALAPTLEAVANAFVALASSTSPIAQAFDAVLANLDRLAIYAGTLAVFLAGRWVAGLAAAALSVRGLATALAFLRGALVRTGIGALIVGAGELVYWFTRLMEGAGGFGEAMGLLKDVAVEVWERIRMGASAAVDPIPGTGAPIVALANQTGATLATEGWAPDRLVLRARDLVSLGSEDSTRLYQVTGDVTSSATGAATLALAPRLRRAPPQFAPLNVSAPQVVLRLTEPVPTRIGRADSYRFSVTAREAL